MKEVLINTINGEFLPVTTKYCQNGLAITNAIVETIHGPIETRFPVITHISSGRTLGPEFFHNFEDAKAVIDALDEYDFTDYPESEEDRHALLAAFVNAVKTIVPEWEPLKREVDREMWYQALDFVSEN